MTIDLASPRSTVAVITGRQLDHDGVSQEQRKSFHPYLEDRGCRVVYYAGKLTSDLEGEIDPLMDLLHPSTVQIMEEMFPFWTPEPAPGFDFRLRAHVETLKTGLRGFLDRERPSFIIVQNIFAIPMYIPQAIAICEILVERPDLKCISVEHDYAWERERFANPRMPQLFGTYFPPDLPNVVHVAINPLGAAELYRQRGIVAHVLPNVVHFERPPFPSDAYSRTLRQRLGLREDEAYLLQGTRIIGRKRIHLSMELAEALGIPLVISHAAGDEGAECLAQLEAQAARMRTRVVHAYSLMSDQRETNGGPLRYTVDDFLREAAGATFPSETEGFGNALLEAVWHRRILATSPYPVFRDYISPLTGLEVVTIGDRLTRSAVEHYRYLLEHPDEARGVTARNYQRCLKHFGHSTRDRVIDEVIADLGLSDQIAA